MRENWKRLPAAAVEVMGDGDGRGRLLDAMGAPQRQGAGRPSPSDPETSEIPERSHRLMSFHRSIT